MATWVLLPAGVADVAIAFLTLAERKVTGSMQRRKGFAYFEAVNHSLL